MKMKTLPSFVLAIALNFAPGVMQAQEIFDAVRSGDYEKVKGLIEKDPGLVKARNARQSIPLHVAVDRDYESIARLLIEKGADVNALNNTGTPLYYAKSAGIARLLVENGTDINAYNPLAWMLVNRRKEVAEYLLEAGAALPETGTPQARLFLVRSLQSGSCKFLEKYLQQGFDPLYKSQSNNTLLHYASESNSTELTDRLMGLGVPANASNLFGWKPLHVAAANGNLQTILSLLKNDPDINARTHDGKTPYNLAVETNKEEVVAYLKSIGADQSPPAFPELKGEYMGQPVPGNIAVLFAPGILSPQHEYHGSITLSPDGNEIYWSAYLDNSGASILFSKRVDGKWQEPKIFSDGDVPFISPDGKKLFFVAFKPDEGGGREVICVRDRTESGWSEPEELPETINSVPGIHWQVSVDRQGNLFFGAAGENGSRIYRSEFRAGEYSNPHILEGLEDMEAFSPYIGPDGKYLIISKVEGGEGLVILFKRKDGSWTKGTELSDVIGNNSAFSPIVTQDGRYLFFTGSVDGKWAPFWIDASFIESLKPGEFQ
jgi:ankyrin repeat protein/Tol biopolymer transport system component